MAKHYEPATLVDLGAADALILGPVGDELDNPITGSQMWTLATESLE